MVHGEGTHISQSTKAPIEGLFKLLQMLLLSVGWMQIIMTSLKLNNDTSTQTFERMASWYLPSNHCPVTSSLETWQSMCYITWAIHIHCLSTWCLLLTFALFSRLALSCRERVWFPWIEMLWGFVFVVAAAHFCFRIQNFFFNLWYKFNLTILFQVWNNATKH